MLICVCGYVLPYLVHVFFVCVCVLSVEVYGVEGGELLMTHSVHSCAPDVLCRVTSDSHLLSLRMVNISTRLIQHC